MVLYSNIGIDHQLKLQWNLPTQIVNDKNIITRSLSYFTEHWSTQAMFVELMPRIHYLFLSGI